MALADEPIRLRPGTPVEVHDRFEGKWARGFEIAEEREDGYRVRRLSDNEVLPVTLREDEVRKERRRETWWL